MNRALVSEMVSQLIQDPSGEPGSAPVSCQRLESTAAISRLCFSRSVVISFVKVSMPKSVWWMMNHSRIPNSLLEITNDWPDQNGGRHPPDRDTLSCTVSKTRTTGRWLQPEHTTSLYLIDQAGQLFNVVPYGLPPSHVLTVVWSLPDAPAQ